MRKTSKQPKGRISGLFYCVEKGETMIRVWLITAGVLAAVSVIMGAFAAHGLKSVLSNYHLEIVKTAAHYQLLHSIALAIISILVLQLGRSFSFSLAGFSFIMGIFLFSGSLYAIAFGAPSWVGPITPIGGLLFVVGWIALTFGVCRSSHI